MLPDLFKIGPLTIHSYGLMMAIAFLLSYYLLRRDFRQAGESIDLLSNMIFWAMIGGVLGAKILFLIENYSDVLVDPKGMIFSGAGLSWFGGLVGGAAAVSWQVIRARRPYFKIADLTSPYLALGHGIGKIGCFLTGCCYGRPTNLPWGLSFPEGAPPVFHPVHPAQLYETIINLSIFFILLKFRQKSKIQGQTFSLFFILTGFSRFFLEFIRQNKVWWWGLTMAQTIALVSFIFGILLFRRLSSVKKS